MLARVASVLCDIGGRARQGAVSGGGGAPSGLQDVELLEQLEARAAGESYQELQQYDRDSAYYDPDVGPYYWED